MKEEGGEVQSARRTPPNSDSFEDGRRVGAQDKKYRWSLEAENAIYLLEKKGGGFEGGLGKISVLQTQETESCQQLCGNLV